MTDDERLGQLLRQALLPTETEPPPESVAALARAVAHGFEPVPGAPRWRARLLVAGSVFAVALSGSATAVAVGAVGLPTPLRVLAHGAGLPVDSVQLAHVKAAAARLRLDLRMGDRSRISRDVSALEASYERLDHHDRRGIDDEVDELLGQAAGSGEDGRSSASTTPGEQIETPGADGDGTNAATGSSRGGPPATVEGAANPEDGSAPDGIDPGRGGTADTSGDRSQTDSVSTVQPQESPGAGGGGGGEASPTTDSAPPTTSDPATTTTVSGTGDGGGDGGSSSSGSSDGGGTGESGP